MAFKNEAELIRALERRAMRYNQTDEVERKKMCKLLGIKYIKYPPSK